MVVAVVQRFARIAPLLALLSAGCRNADRWRVPPPGSRIVIPVFEMHQVVPGENSEYILSPEKLERLLKELNRRGFTSLTLAQFEKAVLEHGPLPPRPALLTFDDAYRDDLNSLPILKRHGWTAVFFVPAGKISDSPDARVAWGEGPDNVGMTWDEVRRLRDEGMDIGAHGVNHVNLKTADDATLKMEMDGRRTIEDKLGIPVTALSYPGGRRDARVLAAAATAGYTIAFLSSGGALELPAADVFQLRRVPVPGEVDPEAVVSSVHECRWE